MGTPRSQRAVALGALVACALAGGAVIHARSTLPPDAASGSADEPDVLARSAAWTREAAPVLAAVEAEIVRGDGFRHRWDVSVRARRGGPPPGAVVALVQRTGELVVHRDALRTAMAAVRSAPASEPALAGAWPALQAAREMLRALASDRDQLGDRVEAAVLGLADEGAPGGAPDDPSPGRAARTATPRGHAATVALVATTSDLPAHPAGARHVAAPTRDAVATAGPVTDVVPPGPAETVADDVVSDTPVASTPRLTTAAAPTDEGTDEGAVEGTDEGAVGGAVEGTDEGAGDGGPATAGDAPSAAPDAETESAAATPPDETILTFEHEPGPDAQS